MKYKIVKKLVLWCDKCDSEIIGNGSTFLPYRCKCGEWEYSREDKKYIIKELLS